MQIDLYTPPKSTVAIRRGAVSSMAMIFPGIARHMSFRFFTYTL